MNKDYKIAWLHVVSDNNLNKNFYGARKRVCQRGKSLWHLYAHHVYMNHDEWRRTLYCLLSRLMTTFTKNTESKIHSFMWIFFFIGCECECSFCALELWTAVYFKALRGDTCPYYLTRHSRRIINVVRIVNAFTSANSRHWKVKFYFKSRYGLKNLNEMKQKEHKYIRWFLYTLTI